MSSRSEVGDLKKLGDSLRAWISEHLGKRSSYMANEVNQLPSSPGKNPYRVDPSDASPPLDDFPNHDDDGMITHSPLENLTSAITQGDLDLLPGRGPG